MKPHIQDAWEAVAALPPLGDDEVQLWWAELPDSHVSDEDMPLEDYLHLLTQDEQARSQRLRAGRVRSQFVVARAVLRTLLGNCTNQAPKDVPITQTNYGKPETVGVHFNMAHSGAAVLIALCRAHPVGVDVEYCSREVDALEIAKSSFAAAEVRALSAIGDEDELRRAFFRCWTRKEAVIKGDGRGLSLSLDSFEVPVEECSTWARIVIPLSGTASNGEWYVASVELLEGAAAALALPVPHLHPRKLLFPLHFVTQTR